MVIALIDSRLADFPFVPVLPHVPINVRFKEGLTKIVSNKSRDKKANATGSGGGYRSSYWIVALIQFYFCIGHFGDVLPNDNNYTLPTMKKIKLGNVTAKIFNAVYSILNLYFQLKKSSFTELEIDELERLTESANTHLTLLWELKQALIDAPPNKRMRLHKNHSILHFPSTIRLFGAPSKFNADTYEGAHPRFTTRPYGKTSKRKASIIKEMTNRIMIDEFMVHRSHLQGITSEKEDYLKTISPKVIGSDHTTYERVQGGVVPHFQLQFDQTSSLFTIVGRNIDEILFHPLLKTSKKLTETLENYFTDNAPEIWDLISTNVVKLNLLSGIKFVGSESSKVGVGTIYATATFRSETHRRPRFDFVEVNTDGGSELAQVLTNLFPLVRVKLIV